jgi:hypothetical protein
MKPVFTADGVNYVYVQHANVYLVALTRKNSNVMVILVFLEKLVEVRLRCWCWCYYNCAHSLSTLVRPAMPSVARCARAHALAHPRITMLYAYTQND